VLENQTVWIKAGHIHRIGPTAEVELPEGIATIDGKGQYLMPGLTEMHAHIPVPKQAGEEATLVANTLFLYLANGITTIRGMLGDPYHLTLIPKVAAGEIPGPRIFTAGPSINGNTAPDPATARRMVEEQQAAGYDFLKLHPGLTTEVFDTIVRTARRVGIPYAGHVSNLVGIDHALANGYASIDHIDGYLEGLVPASAEVDPTANGFFGFNFVELAEEDRIQELAQTTAQNGIAVVPTQSVILRWTSLKSPEDMAKEPEMKYMHPRTLAQWQQSKHGIQGTKNYTPERVSRFAELRRKLIKALQEEGAMLLLGSDSPQVFNVPGFSLHHELEMLIDAGLSPYEALRAGTFQPAVYFGEEGKFGTVTEGAAADLILVPRNPLESVSHLQQKSGVIYRGTWMSEAGIQQQLAELAAYISQLSPEE
jgi:imidazolonepropionase-like amidohydrolase